MTVRDGGIDSLRDGTGFMAQETKVGLLVGLALILLVGLVLSDLLAGGDADQDPNQTPTNFGREAQAGIYPDPQSVTPETRYEARPAEADSPFNAQPANPYAAPANPYRPSDAGIPLQRNEPPLPDLDAVEANNQNAVARFNQSLEAMRLAVTTPSPTPEPAPAVAQVTPVVATVPPPAAGETMYIHYVQPGQTLADIARQHYGNPEFARAIAQVNPDKLGADGQARPGTRLDIPPLGSPVFSQIFEPVHASHAARIDDAVPELPRRSTPPAKTEQKTVVVQAGDTLSELASKHLGSATRWDVLLKANRDQMQSPQDLRSGMTLKIPTTPEDAAAPAPQPAAAPSTPAPAPTPAATTAPRTADSQTYTVEAGDNLTRIAARLLGDGERWDELLEANRDQLDRPESLRVGMKLRLPAGAKAAPTASSSTGPAPASTPKTYTVRAGDNLSRIAAKQLGNSDRWNELFEANRDQLSSPDALYAGQTLRLP